MKYKKILRLLGMITIFSMLLAIIPATPALAAETLTINPTQVKIGDGVNFSGAGYTVGTSTDYYVDVYITDQTVGIGSTIGYTTSGTITRFKRVVWGNFVDTNGTFTGNFLLNTTNSVLNEGSTGAVSPLNLTPGNTYTVFSTGVYGNPSITITSIKAWATLTITPGASLDALTPALYSNPASKDKAFSIRFGLVSVSG